MLMYILNIKHLSIFFLINLVLVKKNMYDFLNALLNIKKNLKKKTRTIY